MADFTRPQAAVEAGDRDTAVAITEEAIGEGIPPMDILAPMTDAMGVVGDRFSRQEVFVPEMLISARAMKGAVALLEPLLTTTMGGMRDVIAATRAADDMPDLRVIVGGAPVSLEFATELTADGWAADAAAAVDMAKAVVETARGNTELSGLIHPGALATAS